MFSVGLLYLIFEKSFIADKKSGGESLASPSADNISRIILGVQVSAHARVCGVSVRLTKVTGRLDSFGNDYHKI